MSIAKVGTWAALSCVLVVGACYEPLELPQPDDSENPEGDVLHPVATDSGPLADGGQQVDSGADPNEPVAVPQIIGTAGGTLSLEGVSDVDVPVAALIEDRELRARAIPADKLPVALPAGAVASAVELTPHGQLFDQPITIRLNYDPALAPESLVVMRLDDDSDVDWEIVEGATFADGVASIQSTTFSYYTVVTFPEPVCTVPAPTAACGGSCTAAQYCSSATTCAPVVQNNLCANTKIYAVHGGESTVDDPAADSMAAAFASHCGGSVTVATLTSTGVIQPCSNELLIGGGNTVLLAGSPYTQRVLRYLDRRISPVFIDTNGTKQQFNTRAGTTLWQFDPASINPGHDYFLVQIFPDTARGALVLSVFGRDGTGTKAGAWYFNNVVVPALHANNRTWNSYLVVEWQDTGDLVAGANDTWTIRASDPLPPPPPVTPPPAVPETPFQSNANGTLAIDQSTNAAAGYKFTPQVNGKVTALGGYFKGTKNVKLFKGTTVLATASVSANNAWTYKSITPVSLTAGTQYTVAVYMAGSGGAKRTSITPLPKIYGSIRIDVPTQASTSILNQNAVPTTNSSPTTTILGLADITFLKD